jgi:hypothetical protein
MSLPFVVQPIATKTVRIGTAATGILEIEVRGGLTVGEAAEINRLQADEESSFSKGAQIADAIAIAEGITLVEAFQLIQDVVVGNQLEERAEELRVRHASSIEEVAKVYAAAGDRTMRATVTALIRCRLAQPDWTMEQTNQLPRALFQGLWDLAQQEIAAEGNESAPPTEEDLKKPPAGKSKRAPTGSKFSGISATDTQDSGTEEPSQESFANAS